MHIFHYNTRHQEENCIIRPVVSQLVCIIFFLSNTCIQLYMHVHAHSVFICAAFGIMLTYQSFPGYIPSYPQGLNEQWISFLQILLNVCVHKLNGIYQNYQYQFEKFMLVYLLDIYKVGTLLIHFHANRTESQQNTSPYIILWVKLGAYPSSARTIISHHALCITRELCWIQFSCIYYCKLTRVSRSISSP